MQFFLYLPKCENISWNSAIECAAIFEQSVKILEENFKTQWFVVTTTASSTQSPSHGVDGATDVPDSGK